MQVDITTRHVLTKQAHVARIGHVGESTMETFSVENVMLLIILMMNKVEVIHQ